MKHHKTKKDRKDLLSIGKQNKNSQNIKYKNIYALINEIKNKSQIIIITSILYCIIFSLNGCIRESIISNQSCSGKSLCKTKQRYFLTNEQEDRTENYNSTARVENG